MARNRMIKPDFWSDEKTGNLSFEAQLMYIGMWNFADDEGIIRYNAAYLRSCICPYKDIGIEHMNELLEELKDFLTVYENHGQKYALIKNFLKHQRVEKPQPTKLPKIDDTDTIHQPFGEQSGNGRGIIGAEVKLSKVKLSKDISNKLDMAQKPGNELVNFLLEEFEKTFGFKPTDKKPRNEAWNLVQRTRTFLKSIGKEFDDNRVRVVLGHYWEWLGKQDWFSNIQTLGVIRRKTNIYFSELQSKQEPKKE